MSYFHFFLIRLQKEDIGLVTDSYDTHKEQRNNNNSTNTGIISRATPNEGVAKTYPNADLP